MPQKTIPQKLLALPNTPGVYEMRNEEGVTLYVGKAKNLKNRVKSYFLTSAQHSPRIQKLIEKTEDIFWTETSSEIEALVLESNLIKEKNPKFNILLRDDKNFIYIAVSIAEDFPRVFPTRRIIKDGSKYFGPKTSTSSVWQTIDLLQDLFHIRTTPLDITENSPGNVTVKSAGNLKYPCLHYHLKKCDAPCIGNISKVEYRKKIDAILSFLKGDQKDVLKHLEEKMKKLASEGKYELAGKVRDQYFAVQKISETQLASAPDEFSADIIGNTELFGRSFFHVFSVRDGKIINSETFSLDLQKTGTEDTLQLEEKEAFQSFLREYPTRIIDPPKVIIIDGKYCTPEEKTLWEEYFKICWEKTVEISIPQKGKRKKLLELAEQNAISYAKRNSASFLKKPQNTDEVLSILQQKLQLPHLPKRIECYDISHFSGTETGASMVVFEKGEPKPSDYRYFSIKSLQKGDINDFASLQEVLTRRLARLPKKFPEEWKWKKLTTKKDFSFYTPIQTDENTILKSCIFYTSEGKIQKQSVVHIWCIEPWSENDGKNWIAREEKDDTARIIFWGKTKEDDEKDRFLITSFLNNLKGKKTAEILLQKNDSKIPLVEEYGFEEVSLDEEQNEQTRLFSKSLIQNKKSSFLEIPDLIVIDGGKGQLSSVKEVLEKTEYQDIPLCSLAKREEEVFIPNQKNPIPIGKDSPEGYLLQRIRDEAHRFAITKNRNDREKSAQKSILDEIPGIGGKTKKILKEKFGSIANIKNATDKDLLEIISLKVLRTLREKL